MRYIRWSFWTLVILLIASFLHYTLPSRDIVRVVDTEVRRVEAAGLTSVFWNSAEPSDPTTGNRDVKFIATIHHDGHPIVYRNEDTGWGWPPYAKFDSANLQAQASDMLSSQSDPTWVALRHYGWRSELFSIYPNALSVEEVAGPDVRLIPWTKIIWLAILAVVALWLWRAIRRFRKRRVDPVVRNVAEAFDAADEHIDARRAQARGGMQRMREWWIENFR